MRDDPKIHKRRSIRLPGYDYSLGGAYFVTICALDKKCLFGQVINKEMRNYDAGIIVEKQWLSLSEKFPDIELDTYVVMPNHFHGIINIESPIEYQRDLEMVRFSESPLHYDVYKRRRMLLSKIVGYFKMNSAKQINILRNMAGESVWQRNYYEHVIRNEKSLLTIYDYIKQNPENWEKDDWFSPV